LDLALHPNSPVERRRALTYLPAQLTPWVLEVAAVDSERAPPLATHQEVEVLTAFLLDHSGSAPFLQEAPVRLLD
jgi:hypothetical protein